MLLSVPSRYLILCSRTKITSEEVRRPRQGRASTHTLISNADAANSFLLQSLDIKIKYDELKLTKCTHSRKILISSALYFGDVPNRSFKNNILFFKRFKNIQVDQYHPNSASKSRNCLNRHSVFTVSRNWGSG